MSTDEKYDVVIAGSGLGGLLCGAILTKHGFRVCVVEKNKQLGGNLQTFARNKKVLDTGVHYLGGLDKGQNLYQIFKYAGLIENLRIEKMDECFDRILLDNDSNTYCQAQGYHRFIKELSQSFPEEEKNIRNYCNQLKEVCASFPLYNLTLQTDGDVYKGNNQSVQSVIESITKNKKLQAVLAGNNLLYAAVADKTPFHVHALIVNSYIESSWKCIGGGSQISKLLAAKIRQGDGHILRNATVSKFIEEGGVITHIENAGGNKIFASDFISNINPATTLSLIQSNLIKSVYRKRIANLEPTLSSFSVHIVLKEKAVHYENANYYYHKEGSLWSPGAYELRNWPVGYGLYFTEDTRNKGFAATVSVLTIMRFDEVTRWANTFNTTSNESSRGADYEAFKQKKAELVLKRVAERFPHIVAHINSYYTSSPLTNRDYIGDETGSMYGIQKDFNHPLKTMISPRTKIPNLFLTGQNLNLHGILGTSLSAVLTCTVLLKDPSLVDKIKNA